MLLLLLPWLPRSCKQCFVLVLGVGRAWSLCSSSHREDENEKYVLVARFCGTLLLAPPPVAAAAAAAECCL